MDIPSPKGAMIVKRVIPYLLALCLLACFFPVAGMADDAGVLAEGELSAWIDQVLRDTRGVEPLNAPVGEESRTEEGYAFIYDFATLYYNKPELDAASILQAISLTDESYPGPRGIALGSSEEAVKAAFGGQNPQLDGDGMFAAFYQLDQLPSAAYWSWAQHDENRKLLQVQCAIHARAGDGVYTDAGLRFHFEEGAVSAIHVYGLTRYLSEQDVRANLAAVADVSSDYGAAHDAPVFSAEDLAFGSVDFRRLTIEQMETVLGARAEREFMDNGEEETLTAEWPGVFLSGTETAMEVLSVSTGALQGPRGICVGDSMEDALAAFGSDGQARTEDDLALLYGDGRHAPYAVLETSGAFQIASYTAQLERGAEALHVTLMLQFEQQRLTEWMLYIW